MLDKPIVQRSFRCQCGRQVFFRNSRCTACGWQLGYEPETAQMLAHLSLNGSDALAPDGVWQATETARPTRGAYKRCANATSAAGCNWLLADGPEQRDADGTPFTLCRSCRLNRTIPDLTLRDNGVWWGRVELAKRRLISSLIALKLPVRSRLSEDEQTGMAFDLLRSTEPSQPVLTGHQDGIITLNVEEADDARRESLRAEFHEPYRTLLGHLRHEVGHYYWQRLIENQAWHAPFRDLFGDESKDYAQALKQYYAQGPKGNWGEYYVSAYASSHPWEDWAETWAHYLHMVDMLNTAASFHLDAAYLSLPYEPFTDTVLYPVEVAIDHGSSDHGSSAQTAADGHVFLSFINDWVQLAAVLNEMSRSMGLPDSYPFVLSQSAVRKLHFVHQLVSAMEEDPALTAGSAPPPTASAAQAA